MPLQDDFPQAFNGLTDLFGEVHVLDKLDRLDEIYESCENAWENNLDNFDDSRVVRYLLIAEAAPWTYFGPVSYFYNTLSGAWVSRGLHAFFEEIPIDQQACLEALAHDGFLLIDSLPFAMPFTTRHRRKPEYCNLINLSSDFVLSKIQNRRIKWADDVRVALAFKWNANRLIDVFPNGLELPTKQTLHLNHDIIAADGSGYTSTARLREIWGI